MQDAGPSAAPLFRSQRGGTKLRQASAQSEAHDRAVAPPDGVSTLPNDGQGTQLPQRQVPQLQLPALMGSQELQGLPLPLLEGQGGHLSPRAASPLWLGGHWSRVHVHQRGHQTHAPCGTCSKGTTQGVSAAVKGSWAGFVSIRGAPGACTPQSLRRGEATRGVDCTADSFPAAVLPGRQWASRADRVLAQHVTACRQTSPRHGVVL